jgi:hypothetical protein
MHYIRDHSWKRKKESHSVYRVLSTPLICYGGRCDKTNARTGYITGKNAGVSIFHFVPSFAGDVTSSIVGAYNRRFIIITPRRCHCCPPLFGTLIFPMTKVECIKEPHRHATLVDDSKMFDFCITRSFDSCVREVIIQLNWLERTNWQVWEGPCNAAHITPKVQHD